MYAGSARGRELDFAGYARPHLPYLTRASGFFEGSLLPCRFAQGLKAEGFDRNITSPPEIAASICHLERLTHRYIDEV